jgi:glycerophosphoryl diester phosphodiesterase
MSVWAGAAAVLVTVAACGGDESTDATTVVPTESEVPGGTEAPVTEPPSTEPPATEPPSTEPPATEPPATEPPATEPPATEPSEAPEERAIDQVPTPEASTVEELLALDRPVVIAHAGGDFEWPHSTMYAFTEAALAGTDVLEMDVMLTADGVLVVQHDDTVDRLTDATGQVRTFTYDELSALDNAHWFSGGVWSDTSLPDDSYVFRGVRTGEVEPPAGYSPDDFRIETFRSVAEAFPDHVLDVELKVPETAEGQDDLAFAIEGAQVLADEIAELGRTDSTIVVSFSTEVLEAFRSFAPDVVTSPGLTTLVDWYVGAPVEFAPSDRVFQVPPVYEGVEVLTADVIARAQAEGYAVWVWMEDTTTQETAEFYSEMVARGVDGLLVSRPTVAVDLVR